MANLPAFQFYPGDWIQDTRCLSLAAKGAWIDLLCAMWRSQTRGTLSMPLVGYSRLIGATVDQATAVIDELTDMHICEKNTCNGIVTLINRRMKREEEERESTRIRVQNFRNKNDVTEHVQPLKRQCNGDVTEMYAPSSSSSSEELKSSSKEKREEKESASWEVVSENAGRNRLPPLSAYEPTNPSTGSGQANEHAESSTSSLKNGENQEEIKRKARPTFRGFDSNAQKSPGKLEMVWIASGKPKAEYDRLTAPPLPELSEDDLECLEVAGIELSKKTGWYYRRGKALLGEGKFSELCHTCKNLRLEGKRPKNNETARFMSYLAAEVAK